MELFLVCFFSVFIVMVSFWCFRGTILDINPRSGLVWSPIYYKTLALILVPLIMVQLFPLSELSINPPPATSSQINEITAYSLLAVLLFTMILAFFLRNSRTAHDIARASWSGHDGLIFIRFGYVFSFLAVLLFALGALFLGHKHALITAVISGDNLLDVRLANAYSSNLPSQIAAFFSMAYKVSAISSGVAFAMRKRTHSFILICMALFVSSIGGSKAPLATALIFFTLAYVVYSRPSFGLRMVFWYFLVYPVAILATVFFITSYQIPDLDLVSFFAFIFKRLGFGQMSGTFNTFSIPELHGDYFYHIIPFASFLVDYPIYQKDLMLYVMQTDYEKTGMQNSLFISEAYGIGGWALALFSPLIVGASYFFGFLVFYLYFKIGVCERVAKFYVFPIYISTMSLTGGFSSFPMLKGVILLMILVVPVVLVWQIISLFRLKR